MKLTIETVRFRRALSHVQRVIPTRSTLPVLSCVLLEATQHGISLNTTDLERWIQVDVSADVDKVGSLAVPAKLLMAILKTVKAPTISLETNGPKLIIRADLAVYEVIGLSSDQYPPAPKLEPDVEFEMEQADLAKRLSQVAFAMSCDETRYVLNGVYWLDERDRPPMVILGDHHLQVLMPMRRDS